MLLVILEFFLYIYMFVFCQVIVVFSEDFDNGFVFKVIQELIYLDYIEFVVQVLIFIEDIDRLEINFGEVDILFSQIGFG